MNIQEAACKLCDAFHKFETTRNAFRARNVDAREYYIHGWLEFLSKTPNNYINEKTATCI